MKYAIVENGRNQEMLKEGETVLVDKAGLKSGEKYVFDKVLFMRDGESIKTGTPYVKNAAVNAKALESVKGPKTINFKKKRRKGYKRKVGHRQKFTRVLVESIK